MNRTGLRILVLTYPICPWFTVIQSFAMFGIPVHSMALESPHVRAVHRFRGASVICKQQTATRQFVVSRMQSDLSHSKFGGSLNETSYRYHDRI